MQTACDKCGGTLNYSGRISLPPQTIYRCETCRDFKWIATAPPPYSPRGVQPVEQPQAQQQQQPQIDDEKKE